MQPTTFTQSLLDRYIDEEKALQERQQSLAALTVHLDANDLAMLNTISKRFNKNRAEVAEELLANALIDIFTRFESGERKLLARDADEMARSLANDIAEDNGLREIAVKTTVWAGHDREATKIERKLAREQANQQQEQELDTNDNSDEDEFAEPSANDSAPIAIEEPQVASVFN